MGESLERMDQELADVQLAVVIDTVYCIRSTKFTVFATVPRGVSQNVVYVLILFWVALDGELQESRVEVESVFNFPCLGLQN